jgi:hypothetical protein
MPSAKDCRVLVCYFLDRNKDNNLYIIRMRGKNVLYVAP